MCLPDNTDSGMAARYSHCPVTRDRRSALSGRDFESNQREYAFALPAAAG